MARHRDLTGAAAVHPAAYVSATDPGPVGQDKLWVDTSSGPPYALKMRDSLDTSWEEVGLSSSDITDAELLAISGLTSAADTLAYFTGSGTAALTPLTSMARSLLDDTSASSMRTTLGLVIGTNVQAQDAELAALAGLTSAADNFPYFTGSGAAALLTIVSAIRTVLASTDLATLRTNIGLGTADTPTLTGLELGNNTDTTLTRSAAGILAVEGKDVVLQGVGQIAFPASQNASSNVNTLDDYEEGAWTPVLSYATPGTSSWAVTTQLGWYTKIGNRVFWEFLYQGVPTNGTASSTLLVDGLPYNSVNTANKFGGGSCEFQGYTKANFTQITCRIFTANSTQLNFRAAGSGQTSAALVVGDIPSGGTVIVRSAGHYSTA